MRLTLCNEVVRDLPFAAQCGLAAGLGYAGLEVAPFTLDAEAPHLLPAARRAEARRAAADAGIAITGLHWLLIAPAGLSITSADPGVRARTLEVIERLIGLAADLGAGYLVHGSPGQRQVVAAGDAARAEATMARIAGWAADAGVTYCLEPLAARETNWATTVAEAVAIIDRIGSPALRTMLDVCAAGNGEAEPVVALLDRWLPTGKLAHIHLNDRNRRAPGQGERPFRADPRRAAAARLCRVLRRRALRVFAGRAGQRRLRRGLPAGRAGGSGMTAPRFAITAIERREWPFTLRLPFRFGVVTVTQGRQAVVRVRIRDEAGREGWGVAAETLAAKWFDKDPALSDADNENQLRRVAGTGRRSLAGRRQQHRLRAFRR